MAAKTKSGTKSKAKAEPNSQVVEEKKCSLLHKLICSFTACILDDSFQRCNYCDYNRTDGCARNCRRDAAALLKCVSVESIKFRCIPLTYIDGDNEITVYRPHFGFRIKSERHYWKRYKNSNSFMLDTREGIIYRENLIQGIECCFPEDENTHRPKCQNCPYHALGCDEILELQILAFLMSITDSDVDEEALDAILNPPLPIDSETGMIIGSTEYLNYLDAIFQIDD